MLSFCFSLMKYDSVPGLTQLRSDQGYVQTRGWQYMDQGLHLAHKRD